MSFRDKIKEQAIMLNQIEELEQYLKDGFIENIERFGSTPNSNEFRIIGDFKFGSGIKGSVAEKMYAAQRLGLEKLEKCLHDAALEIV